MENATQDSIHRWTQDFLTSLATDLLSLTSSSTANVEWNPTTTTATTLKEHLTTTTDASNNKTFTLADDFDFSPDMTSLRPTLSTDRGNREEDPFLPWDNPYNVISLETFLSFETVMTCGANVIMLLVGVPLNVLSAVVFYRQGLRDRMYLCLFSLAIVDTLFVVFFNVVGSYCLVEAVLGPQEGQDPDRGFSVQWLKFFTRKYFTGLYRGFLYASGCLTAVIALERCVCVVKPLKFPTLISTRTMGIIIGMIVGGLQLAAVLYPLQLDIGSRVNPETGRTTLFLSATSFYYDHKVLYTVVEDTVLMVVIPFSTFIVVTVTTAVTVLELRLRLRWRLAATTSANNGLKGQVNLVKMLVVVSTIYILTAAPNVALGLARVFVPEFRHTKRYANIFLFSHLFYLEMAMFNSSINFFVYVVRSSRFRAHLAAMCGRTTPTPSTAAMSSDSASRTRY